MHYLGSGEQPLKKVPLEVHENEHRAISVERCSPGRIGDFSFPGRRLAEPVSGHSTPAASSAAPSTSIGNHG